MTPPEAFDWWHIGAISLAWILYGALHSLLASRTVKRFFARRWPRWMPWYRLLFNLVALVTLIPPLILTYRHGGPQLWQWTGLGRWIADGLALLALGGFAYSLNWYDSETFLGLRQRREGWTDLDDPGSLQLSPLHRFVRHPWYSLGLVLIWTRSMNAALFTSALWISLYLLIGSRLEERKLLERYGDRYRRYRAAVPGLLPRPWRYLSAQQARALVRAEPPSS